MDVRLLACIVPMAPFVFIGTAMMFGGWGDYISAQSVAIMAFYVLGSSVFGESFWLA